MPTTTGLATSFITFSRPGASGGGATVTDRDGKIKWAGHNLLTNSESFDASAWLKNGAVVVTANAAVAPNGTTTADRLNTPSGVSTYQQAAIIAGAKYKIAVWAKRSGSTNQTFRLFGDSAILSSDLTATADWQLFEFEFTAATGGATRDNGITGGTGAAAYDITVWGAHLYRSDLGGMQANPAMGAGMGSYYPTTPRNLLGNTEDLTQGVGPAYGSSAVANVALAPNGLMTADELKDDGTASNFHYLVRTIATVAGSTYVLSGYFKANTSNYVILNAANFTTGSLYAAASFNLASGTLISSSAAGTGYSVVGTPTITSVGNGWYRCAMVFTAGTTTPNTIAVGLTDDGTYSSYGLKVYNGSSSGVFGWGLQFSDSASLDTYVPQYGAAVTSAAYYAPRLDFDGATLSPRGLLVEEQRTNLALHNTAFDNAAWYKTDVTITANDDIAPDGTQTADLVTLVGAAGGSQTLYAFDTQTGTYTVSFYVKAKAAGDVGTTIILDSTGAGSTSKTVTLSAAWQRVSITIAPTGYFQYRLISLPGATATKFLVWGAQVEAGSFPTSLIPTGSATATRTADVASVSVQAFPYSDTAGTVVVKASSLSIGAYNEGLATLYNAGSNFIGMGRRYAGGDADKIYLLVASNSSTEAYIGGGTIAANAVYGAAGAYKANDFAISVNGGAVVSDTSGAVPVAAATSLQIGQTYANEKINGHIRQITYLPRRISNAELQQRTA